MAETQLDRAERHVIALRLIIAVQKAMIAHMRDLSDYRSAALGREVVNSLRGSLMNAEQQLGCFSRGE